MADKFGIQLLSKGSFFDTDSDTDRPSYLVEVYTVKLNHIALNEWLLSECLNSRDCYDTSEEWGKHKAEFRAKREVWNRKFLAALGISPEARGVSITQAFAEVFTVVHIREI